MFVSPMLARPKPENFILHPGQWAAEEKYDGHRLLVETSDGGQPNLFVQKGITAWSRYGIERKLPTHLLEALAVLPNGLYDGELIVPGKRSYGVTKLTNGPDLVYVVFDAIRVEDVDYTELTYETRRCCLDLYFNQIGQNGPLRHAPSWNVDSMIEVCELRDKIWAREGEGLILKNRHGLYEIGKRSKYLIKIKDKKSKVLKVVAWAESQGEKDYRGKYATAIIKDDEGFTTTVKTKNNNELHRLEAEAERVKGDPFIGRELRIEYQERTPDGSYRHPRWDRWEDE